MASQLAFRNYKIIKPYCPQNSKQLNCTKAYVYRKFSVITFKPFWQGMDDIPSIKERNKLKIQSEIKILRDNFNYQ